MTVRMGKGRIGRKMVVSDKWKRQSSWKGGKGGKETRAKANREEQAGISVENMRSNGWSETSTPMHPRQTLNLKAYKYEETFFSVVLCHLGNLHI